jgi:sugar O-acyltransferase (sialic acid O-acetyltransferase NeuD family)
MHIEAKIQFRFLADARLIFYFAIYSLNDMSNVIIFGVTVSAATIIDGIINSVKEKDYKIIGFLDDDLSKHGKSFFGLPVLGAFSDLIDVVNNYNISSFIIGVSDHRCMLIRARVAQIAVKAGLTPVVSIHSKATMVNSSVIGSGAFIMPNVYVGVETDIGEHCSIHAGVSILELCKIGHNVMIAGNSFVGGYVKIGDNVYIGPGSKIASGVEIGSNCLIGAGSLVLKNIPSNTAAFGSPVNLMRQNNYYI